MPDEPKPPGALIIDAICHFWEVAVPRALQSIAQEQNQKPEDKVNAR